MSARTRFDHSRIPPLRRTSGNVPSRCDRRRSRHWREKRSGLLAIERTILPAQRCWRNFAQRNLCLPCMTRIGTWAVSDMSYVVLQHLVNPERHISFHQTKRCPNGLSSASFQGEALVGSPCVPTTMQPYAYEPTKRIHEGIFSHLTAKSSVKRGMGARNPRPVSITRRHSKSDR
jgi:hypothetical protein